MKFQVSNVSIKVWEFLVELVSEPRKKLIGRQITSGSLCVAFIFILSNLGEKSLKTAPVHGPAAFFKTDLHA